MSDASSLALLGGPATGKTTYLGALVDALQTHQLQHLRLDGLAADARGLSRLAEPLLGGGYPQRTNTAERHELVARLRTEGTLFQHSTFTLRAGDYDGEEVDRLFRDRIHGWTPEWQQRALSNGLLLLVRADPRSPLPITDAPALTQTEHWRRFRKQAGTERASPPDTAVPSSAPSSPEIFHGSLHVEETPPPPRLSPSAPVAVPDTFPLIELLQFIRHVRGLAPGRRPRGTERFRIALLVSAWDTMDPAWHQAGPATWLAQRFPLLEDFLWSNFLGDDIFRFGLSSTGGDLNDARYRSQYLDNPCGFVEWRDPLLGMRRTRDIGLPLYWLLFGDPAFSAAVT
jgi:hypothetical protein